MGIAKSSEYEYAVSEKPLVPDEGSGDCGFVVEQEQSLFIVVLDVLGHGEKAFELALKCEEFLREHPVEDPCLVLQALHEYIRGSRGAAVALTLVDRRTGDVCYAAVGNITARLFGIHYRRLVNQDGVVGFRMPTVRPQYFTLSNSDVLMLYTDGVREHIAEGNYPGIRTNSTQTIAHEILRRFGKGTDDACCCVLKKLK